MPASKPTQSPRISHLFHPIHAFDKWVVSGFSVGGGVGVGIGFDVPWIILGVAVLVFTVLLLMLFTPRIRVDVDVENDHLTLSYGWIRPRRFLYVLSEFRRIELEEDPSEANMYMPVVVLEQGREPLTNSWSSTHDEQAWAKINKLILESRSNGSLVAAATQTK